ncbi:hypothetical protein R0G64_31530, partial [Pseudomonas otitidis]
VLTLTLTQAKVTEIREYSIKQNLTTVRNRVNELGVAALAGLQVEVIESLADQGLGLVQALLVAEAKLEAVV